MSYTVKDLKDAVDYFTPGGEHTWDWVLGTLHKGPLQLTSSVGVLEFVREVEGTVDSYGSGSTSLILKVTNPWWNPRERFFKLTSDSSSFGGTYYSDLDEVKQVKVERTAWELV